MSKFVWGALLILTCAPAAAGAADQWQIGTASSYSSGRYGTDSRTDILHTPVSARRLFDDGDVTIVFAFTCISGDGAVTVVDGSPVRNQRGVPSGTGRDGSVRTGTQVVAPEETRCGLGDIVVRGRYYVLDERGWLPTVAVRGHVKAPTASESLGLGTGRPDEGIGIEVSRTIAGSLLAMADAGYTLIGEPTGTDYDNHWWYDVGVGLDLANGLLNLSVFFGADRTYVSGFANARDILTAVTVRAPNGWRIQASGQVGLSEGAPARVVTLGASRRF